MGIAVYWDIFLSFVWNPCFLSCFSIIVANSYLISIHKNEGILGKLKNIEFV